MTGAITGYIDVAQLTLYAFWAFFAGLVFYLRREDKREGYPLQAEHPGQGVITGFPSLPTPKVFILPHGGTVMAPRPEVHRPIAARRAEPWAGAPLVPTGNPMIDGVGPAAYAMRSEEPDMTFDDNQPRIVPLRTDPEFYIATEDPDPRGMTVYGCDRLAAGVANDVWVDRSEMVVRYVEVAVTIEGGTRPVLVPMNMLQIDRTRRWINVRSITTAQFANVPGLRSPNQVSLREEDMIMGYFGGGTLYATPERSEPLL